MSLKTIRVLWRMCFYTTNSNCSGNYQGLITGLIGHNRVIVTTKALLEWVTEIVTQCWVAAEFKVETRVLRSVCLCVCVCLAVNFYKDTEWVVSCWMVINVEMWNLWCLVHNSLTFEQLLIVCCVMSPLNHERLPNLTNCHTHSKSWQAAVLRSCQTLTMGPQVKTSSFDFIFWIQLHFVFNITVYQSCSWYSIGSHWKWLLEQVQ